MMCVGVAYSNRWEMDALKRAVEMLEGLDLPVGWLGTHLLITLSSASRGYSRKSFTEPKSVS